MDPIESNLITILITLIASSGLWSLVLYVIQRRDAKKDKSEELLNSFNSLKEELLKLQIDVAKIHKNQEEKAYSEELNKSLLIGLAHDRIIYLGQYHIEQGYITHSQYKELHDDLFIPYSNLGGNGEAKKVMDEVEELPIR